MLRRRLNLRLTRGNHFLINHRKRRALQRNILLLVSKSDNIIIYQACVWLTGVPIV